MRCYKKRHHLGGALSSWCD